MDELNVYYESRTVGTIAVHATVRASPTHPSGWRRGGPFPVSLLMPLVAAPRAAEDCSCRGRRTCCPESTQLRAIGLQLGAAPEDVIGILAELGRDTAGALSVGKPGTTSTHDWKPIPSDKALEKILGELPSKPFLVGEDGVLDVARPACRRSSASPSTTKAASACRSTAHLRRGY
ncbi:MAG: HipA N-terminal domain-containing protein [Hyphomicrobium sp.]